MKIGKFLKDAGVAKSISEGNRLIKEGAISMNKEKVDKDVTHIYIVGTKYYLSKVDLSKVKKMEGNGKTVYYIDK